MQLNDRRLFVISDNTKSHLLIPKPSQHQDLGLKIGSTDDLDTNYSLYSAPNSSRFVTSIRLNDDRIVHLLYPVTLERGYNDRLSKAPANFYVPVQEGLYIEKSIAALAGGDREISTEIARIKAVCESQNPGMHFVPVRVSTRHQLYFDLGILRVSLKPSEQWLRSLVAAGINKVGALSLFSTGQPA